MEVVRQLVRSCFLDFSEGKRKRGNVKMRDKKMKHLEVKLSHAMDQMLVSFSSADSSTAWVFSFPSGFFLFTVINNKTIRWQENGVNAWEFPDLECHSFLGELLNGLSFLKTRFPFLSLLD